MQFRTEEDSLGKVRVPSDAYYGAHTVRALENFPMPHKFQPEFIQAYAIVKQAAAMANMSTGRLNSRIGHAILRACSEIASGKLYEQFPVSVYQQGAGTTTNMNINEVVANRAIEILGGTKGSYDIVHPNDHVNMAQSTNDTFHTATHVAAVIHSTKFLLPAVQGLEKSLRSKSKEFSGIVKTGRTHMQDAVPITLGQEFGGYAAAVGKGYDHIKNAATELLEVNLGGTAVGTGLNAEPKYRAQVIKNLNMLTKMKFRPAKNMFEATSNITEIVHMSSSLKTLSLSLIKIANDMRLLSSGPNTGLNEIRLPTMNPGSSIMPGKINPSVPEFVDMVGFQVVGNDTTITMVAESAQLELNVFMPISTYKLMNSIKVIAKACEIFDRSCVRGIKANEKKINEYNERNPIFVTALTPYIGYEKAAAVAKKSYETGKSLREICIEMKLLSGKELDKALSPRDLTKPGIAKKGK